MGSQSPHSVAVQTSTSAGVITMICTALVMWLAGVSEHAWMPPVSGLMVAVFSYVMIYRQLGLYLQERLRIIYKTIRRLKGSTSHVNLDMGQDVIEQVNRDVMTWADSQIEEITTLREADTFRKEFIGNLAHELKTPIFNIQGFILTLLEGGLNDPEINRKFLLKAAKNVDRMAGMLDNLDVITKMESGTLDIELVPFDLLEIIRETMESLEPKARRSEIDLRTTAKSPASKLGPTITS